MRSLVLPLAAATLLLPGCGDHSTCDRLAPPKEAEVDQTRRGDEVVRLVETGGAAIPCTVFGDRWIEQTGDDR